METLVPSRNHGRLLSITCNSNILNPYLVVLRFKRRDPDFKNLNNFLKWIEIPEAVPLLGRESTSDNLNGARSMLRAAVKSQPLALRPAAPAAKNCKLGK